MLSLATLALLALGSVATVQLALHQAARRPQAIPVRLRARRRP